ncbi:MAG: hypothetical protein WEC81_00220 [Patescibacteria group bacterium]
MRSLQDEIRQAQKDLSCPICARTFQLRDIRIRSFLGNGSAELSVVCSRGHFPVILLVPVNLKEVTNAGPITEGEIQRLGKKISKLNRSISELISKK